MVNAVYCGGPDAERVERELRAVFRGTLDGGVSRVGIMVAYTDGMGNRRIVCGVPYSIEGTNLVVGSYFKDLHSSVPED